MPKPETTFAQRVQEYSRRLSADGLCALGGLFDLTSTRLVRFAVAVTHHQQDAEDVVQSVLVRVADNPRLLKSADCPWAYLLKMVRNEALMAQRKQKRVALLSDLADLQTRCRVDEVEHEEAFREVWRALRRLPCEQSEVVVLKVWEEMTFAQVAEVLDISANTAASRYRYALDKLSRTLTRSESEVTRD